MSIIGRVLYGISDTRAYLSNKTSAAKLRLMRFFGLDITLFGGPSQPEPLDPRGGIQAARQDAEENGEIANPNQYENGANWESHYRWTGPQITKQLPEVNVICAGMGTSGTMTGMGTYLKEKKPSVKLVACCTAPGQRVPGPRSQALLGPIEFPWRDAVDQIEEVGEVDSYTLSMKLSREGLICGPSSGFNLKGRCPAQDIRSHIRRHRLTRPGLYQMLERRKASGALDALRNSDGSIHRVFICCDLPYQYIDEYFTKLDEDSFPPLHNSVSRVLGTPHSVTASCSCIQNLSKVDLYRYDSAWELEAADALARIYGLSCDEANRSEVSQGLDALFQGTTSVTSFDERNILLDLRTPSDFAAWNFPFSENLPLESLSADTDSPFKDAVILEKQWLELDELFRADDSRVMELQGKQVLALCYDGDTSRVAASVLRAKGVDACSLRGGLRELCKSWIPLAERRSGDIAAASSNGKVDAVADADAGWTTTDASVMPELTRPVVA